jgi:hypothetical protein
MSVAEAAVPFAPAIATKMLYRAIDAVSTVVERPAITAGLFELKMVSDFFGNGSWIFSKLSTDALEGFSLY